MAKTRKTKTQRNPFEPGQKVKYVVASTGEAKAGKIEEPVTLLRFELSHKKGDFAPASLLTRKGKHDLLRDVPKEKRGKWEKADPNSVKKGLKVGAGEVTKVTETHGGQVMPDGYRLGRKPVITTETHEFKKNRWVPVAA